MDQLNKNPTFNQWSSSSTPRFIKFHQQLPDPTPSLKSNEETADAARKSQKADREKSRRDRINEQFLELGYIVDPGQPRHDKATILADTVQLLKDLNSEVSKRRIEYALLTEESHELAQEKNDLREEKVSLKSDITKLNVEWQQKVAPQWGAIDQSVLVASSYPFSFPMPMPPMQMYPFFGGQNLSAIPGPCSTYTPYFTSNMIAEQQSTHEPLSLRPRILSQDSREKTENSNVIATENELTNLGSTSDLDLFLRQRKPKKNRKKESRNRIESSSSRCSTPNSGYGSSSKNIIRGIIENDADVLKDR